MKQCLLLLVALSLSALLGACSPQTTPTTPAPASTYFPISIGTAQTQLQLALSVPEKAQGLMHRDSMPADHGMLFMFETPREMGFWMKNTKIPLDIGYFDASGKLLEIHTLYPYDENPVHSYSKQILIAIEMNKGWYAENAIKPGAMIHLGQLNKALLERGKLINTYPIQQQK